MAGIFGPGADAVRQAVEQQQMEQDRSWASVPAGRGPVAGMAMAGRQLGNAIQGAAGYEDPQVKKAKLLEEAKMEVDQSGADLMADPKSYYNAAYKALAKRGLTDEAMGIRNLLIDEESAGADAEYKRAKAKALDEKERYQKIGSGGLYDTVTQQVVAEGKQGDDRKGLTELEKLQMALRNPDITDQERSQIEARITKINKPSGSSAMDALAAGFNTLAEAERAKYGSREGGKLDAKDLDGMSKEARDAMVVNQSLTNIESSLATGNTTFGSMAEQRRSAVSFIKTFAPNLADPMERLLSLDLNSYDAIEKENKTILANLAKDLGGSKATAMALQTMEKAGPSVFQTNEGMAIVTKGLRKRNQYKIDRIAFANQWEAEHEGQSVPRHIMSQWELDNYSSPKYTLTPQDIGDATGLVKKAQRIKNLSRKSVTLPANPNDLVDGKLYARQGDNGEPEFLRWNKQKGKLVEEVN